MMPSAVARPQVVKQQSTNGGGEAFQGVGSGG